MTHPKLSLRRPLAILGATFVGLAATLAVAAPASAHAGDLKGTHRCDTVTGEWVVDWTVLNDMDSKVAKIEKVISLTPAGTNLTGITVGAEVPKRNGAMSNQDSWGKLTGEQRVPASASSASLSVELKWPQFSGKPVYSKTITFEGTCAKPTPPTTPTTPTNPTPPAKVTKPTASFSSDCDGTVTVILSNGKDATDDVELVVSAKEFNKKVTVAPNGSSEPIVVPAGAGTIKITEGDKAVGDSYTWTKSEDCVPPGEPTGNYGSTCDELLFEVTNPENGKTVTITFTPNKGEPKTITVEPGKTETAKFPAEEGLTVTPSSEGMEESGPIAWEKPADCAEGGAGAGDDGPTLPLTGAAAGGIAAAAAVLLAAGAVLFVVFRRRRVRFTA
ncbi:LPXTG cell wall anchor domain-containing protein [Micromonospora sp. NBC_01699]|uniref:LPXTG cell wall anchor domain-containing protein n=1 Tax=Micromonospora sp. NBC_01699 TaxID=2975984 RepID=UPI002E2F2750|nr:LPXTG cell wall anchor domain-containing protein [Micromonospora sp. NBC_01699]